MRNLSFRASTVWLLLISLIIVSVSCSTVPDEDNNSSDAECNSPQVLISGTCCNDSDSNQVCDDAVGASEDNRTQEILSQLEKIDQAIKEAKRTDSLNDSLDTETLSAEINDVVNSSVDSDDESEQPTKLSWAELQNPYLGGINGLSLEFVDDMPPQRIYDHEESNFTIGVKLKNEGESDIGSETANPYMSLSIEGLLPSSFGVDESYFHRGVDGRINGSRMVLNGAKQTGGSTQLMFEGLSFIGDLAADDEVNIRAVACYDYSTDAMTYACSSLDSSDGSCKIVGDHEFYTSGAPIRISRIVQSPISENKVQLNFQLSNIGDGTVYYRDDLSGCNPSVSNKNKNWLQISVLSENPSINISCYRLNDSNVGRIKLYANAPVHLSCIVENLDNETSSFNEVLNIRLTYRYSQYIEQPIKITRLG